MAREDVPDSQLYYRRIKMRLELGAAPAINPPRAHALTWSLFLWWSSHAFVLSSPPHIPSLRYKPGKNKCASGVFNRDLV